MLGEIEAKRSLDAQITAVLRYVAEVRQLEAELAHAQQRVAAVSQFTQNVIGDALSLMKKGDFVALVRLCSQTEDDAEM